MYSIIQNGTGETARHRELYGVENTQLALRRKTSQTLGEDGATIIASLKEGFSTTKNALERRLQQAQNNSQELQNGGCVSGVRRKRRGPGVIPI